MKKLILLLSILFMFGTLLSVACSGTDSNGAGNNGLGTKVSINGGLYMDINSSELNQMLQNKDFILVNTDPVATKAIPNTDLFIPKDEVIDDLSLVSKNKNEKIVVYCMVGSNSRLVAAEFAEMGYTDIYNLSGGILEWEQQGYRVVNP